MYYVYAHINPENDGLLYIGKGTDGRAWDIYTRGRGHKETLQAYVLSHGRGSYVRIIADNLENEHALMLEKRLIHECQPPFNNTKPVLSEADELDWKDDAHLIDILWNPGGAL